MPGRKKKIFKRKKKINYGNSGIKRLFNPFNKFTPHSSRVNDTRKMARQGNNEDSGLSQKEKSYVICSCQSKSNRYLKLKALADTAKRQNKIFSIYGSCNAVRKALLERGWIEKVPPNRMNLSKIRNGTFTSKNEIRGELERLLLSNLVEKCNPNFIWRTRDERRDTTIDMTRYCYTIINKLETDALWTSKQGLCSSIKINYWFYIENVAEVNSPRSYNTSDYGEIESFDNDYKITACTSLLKWILSMAANDRPIFNKSGRISMNVVVFALNRCKEYLFRKQNKDIDRPISEISSGQWNSFLKKYYCVISKDEVFQTDKENKLPLYLSYAKYLLKEIHRYRPQLSCEGCHNIWIIKPAYCSRGRGIRMASKLGVIRNLLSKANSKYVIQKYIEEPLLIYETKFDIRQYYLVTSTYPLIIWMYKDCYLKFSSQKYSLKNYHESIHLTNNAVQRNYVNCKGRHAELPKHNMWDLEKYKQYLNKIGMEKVWENIIYPGMKKSIIGIMLSCQDSLTVSRNRFELYGCDFILDKDYKPWLIEINSCPDLNHTTQVTAKICPAVVSDIIKVVIDHAKNSKAPTGRFECIYRQPMTMPRYGTATDLVVRGYSLPIEYFYRGKIEIQESYDDPKIGKESDIKAVLAKLKQFYDTDIIMKQPEEDYYIPDKKEKDTCTHKTVSEYEMSVTAVAISEQMNLIDRITPDNTFSENTDLKSDASSASKSQELLNLVQNVRSVTEIKCLLKRSTTRFNSCEIIDKTFSFSRLDDDSNGKDSIAELKHRDKLISDLLPKTVLNNIRSTEQLLGIFSQEVLEATSKIVSFINNKEKEYCNTKHYAILN